MPINRPPALRRPMLHALSVAAAATLMAAAPDARAQSFTQSGANSTSPNNLLPFVGSPTSLNFGSDTVYIGNSALGSFSALAGAVLNAGALSIANGGGALAIGTVSLSGAGTKVELGGSNNRLEVGNWGTGTLTVSAGALLDATVNAAACTGGSCYTFIGNAAGSTGTLTVTGAGSEVRTLRSFTVGQTSVFTNPPTAFVFGTPGGTTSGSVNVLAGGKLDTEGGVGVGINNRSPNGNGSEKAFGTVIVDGANSLWQVRRNSIDNQVASMTLGFGVDGNGKVEVRNGGQLRVDGTGAPALQDDFINLGVNGGKGELKVTGAGSSLDMIGYGGAIQAGRSGATGSGTFSVLAGASAGAVFLNVGRDASTGTVLVDGAGSQLLLSGQGAYSSGGVGTGGGVIGWGGTGQVTVSNGALWSVSDNGTDNSATNRGPGITLGLTSASTGAGTGSLFITGANSRVELVSSTLSPPAGTPDNGNPFVHVGRDGNNTGTLSIGNGGKLLITGNALSTPTHGRTTYLGVGGTSDTNVGGDGNMSIDGPGSEARLAGVDAFVSVGRNGTGTMSLSNGALLTATSINVGRAASGNGTLTMDASTITLSGQFTDANAAGASLSIGNRGGTGSMTMSSGSTVTLSNLGTAGASLNAGGTGLNPLGNGTLTMSGGSSITIVTQPGLASASVGRDGTGLATLSGASQIDIGDGTVHIGRLPTGVGTVNVLSGSKILAGTINVGGSSDTTAGGIGTATVDGLGSELKATGPSGFIGIGRSATGTLDVSNQGRLSAIGIAVGRGIGGSGVLTVDNGTVELSGQQATGVQSGAFLSIGSGSGNGVAAFANGTVVNVSNFAGSNGTGVNVGGSGSFPLGTGTLALTGGSQLNINATSATQIGLSIGRTGTGTALVDASAVNVNGGNVYIGREVGSVGTLVMSNGSTLNAGYVGVGTSQPYDGNVYNGGTGILVLNDSTINTGVFELGANGILTGNNGTIDATGDVIIGGTISPGNSPGRIRIMCNVIMVAGSKIILEVSGSGGNYQIDQLIIGNDATFDLASADIVFSFLGDTNPNEASAAGALNLDNFLRTMAIDAPIDAPTQALSTRLAQGETWSDIIDPTKVSAVSETFNVTEFKVTGDGTFAVAAVPVPEPSTWGMLFLGLCAVGAVARRRRQE